MAAKEGMSFGAGASIPAMASLTSSVRCENRFASFRALKPSPSGGCQRHFKVEFGEGEETHESSELPANQSNRHADLRSFIEFHRAKLLICSAMIAVATGRAVSPELSHTQVQQVLAGGRIGGNLHVAASLATSCPLIGSFRPSTSRRNSFPSSGIPDASWTISMRKIFGF